MATQASSQAPNNSLFMRATSFVLPSYFGDIRAKFSPLHIRTFSGPMLRTRPTPEDLFDWTEKSPEKATAPSVVEPRTAFAALGGAEAEAARRPRKRPLEMDVDTLSLESISLAAACNAGAETPDDPPTALEPARSPSPLGPPESPVSRCALVGVPPPAEEPAVALEPVSLAGACGAAADDPQDGRPTALEPPWSPSPSTRETPVSRCSVPLPAVEPNHGVELPPEDAPQPIVVSPPAPDRQPDVEMPAAEEQPETEETPIGEPEPSPVAPPPVGVLPPAEEPSPCAEPPPPVYETLLRMESPSAEPAPAEDPAGGAVALAGEAQYTQEASPVAEPETNQASLPAEELQPNDEPSPVVSPQLNTAPLTEAESERIAEGGSSAEDKRAPKKGIFCLTGCTLPSHHRGCCNFAPISGSHSRKEPARLTVLRSGGYGTVSDSSLAAAPRRVKKERALAGTVLAGNAHATPPVVGAGILPVASRDELGDGAQSTAIAMPEPVPTSPAQPAALQRALPRFFAIAEEEEVELFGAADAVHLGAGTVQEAPCSADKNWPLRGMEPLALEPMAVDAAVVDPAVPLPNDTLTAPLPPPPSVRTTPSSADMPSLEREERLLTQERTAELRFQLLRPSPAGQGVHGGQLAALFRLRDVICAQLPAMDPVYITQLIFRPDHRSIVCLRGGQITGGITYRPFIHGEPDGGFAELVFCVVSTAAQVQGLGTRLMNRFKAQLVADGCHTVLTYADNSAIGFFKQHGYSSAITMPEARWYGRVTQYDNGVLMQGSLDASLPYKQLPHAIRTARERAMANWIEGGGLAPVDDADGAPAPTGPVAPAASGSLGAHDLVGPLLRLALADGNAQLLPHDAGADFGGGIGARLEPDPYAEASLSREAAAQRHELCKVLLKRARGRGGAAASFLPVLGRTHCRYYADTGKEALADVHRHGLSSYVLAPGELRRAFFRLKPSEADDSD